MRFPLSLRMVPGSAAQDTRQKVLYTKAETTALSEIPDSSGIPPETFIDSNAASI